MDGCRESDRFGVPRKPSHKGRPQGPAEKVEGRERAKGNVVQHTRGRTQSRVLPVTGARRRTAGIFGCRRVTTRGRSPVRECRTPGSGRGVLGNWHPCMQNVDLIKQKFETLCPFMDERMRRLWAAAEAQALGRGGITAVAAATGPRAPRLLRACASSRGARRQSALPTGFAGLEVDARR